MRMPKLLVSPAASRCSNWSGYWLLLGCAIGCAKPIIKPPAEFKVTLGSKTAVYRPWDRVTDVCSLDRKIFEADLRSMNELLADFLEQTSAAPEAAWGAEHVALLNEAQKVLPSPLEVERNALAKIRKAGCKVGDLGPAEDLISQANKRLQEAPELLAQVKSQMALKEWKVGISQLMEQGRTGCTPKPKPNATPSVYFASLDENANGLWLFCDDAKVMSSPGSVPAYEAAPVKKGVKAKKPQAYLDAAAAFPTVRISHAPQVVKKALQLNEAAPAPEPKDASK
jgi:hypothetical protein